jgi:hypothetical protein
MPSIRFSGWIGQFRRYFALLSADLPRPPQRPHGHGAGDLPVIRVQLG